MGTGWLASSLGAAAVVLACTAPVSAENGSLDVVIKDVRNDQGEVRVVLWDDPRGFTNDEAVLLESAAPARNGEKRITIKNLPPGVYALVAYHDENANGEFDQTLIGWPAEGLGFSNGAWIGPFGPPSFEEVAIEVNGATSTVIDLRYESGIAVAFAEASRVAGI